MANYKRKVTYFYQYHGNVLGATAGYLKMEIRGDKVKITLNIQESNYDADINPKLCFYHEAGDDLNTVSVCDVRRESGVLTLQTKTDWQSMFNTGRDLYSFDGVIVYYNDNDYYLGDFDNRDRRSYGIVFLDKKQEKQTIEKTDVDIDESELNSELHNQYDSVLKSNVTNSEEIEKAMLDNSVDDFSTMLGKYPKLPMYGVSELFDCVRIHPKDIGRLDIGNWKLGLNSFLTHGYYTYQYLMLGNMRFDDGKKHPVLGVPGMYSDREKYLANMFGFYQFVPVKKTGSKNGQFGYWIVELNEKSI